MYLRYHLAALKGCDGFVIEDVDGNDSSAEIVRCLSKCIHPKPTTNTSCNGSVKTK